MSVAKTAGARSASLINALKNLGMDAMKYVGGAKLANNMATGQGLGRKAAALGFGIGFLSTGDVMGGVIGAAVGFAPVSRRTRQTIQKIGGIAVSSAKFGGRHAVGVGSALTAGAFGVGLVGGTLNRQQLPRVGPVTSGRGYVSWTPGRSGGMSPNHLGATGGLTLALFGNRHKINPKALNLA